MNWHLSFTRSGAAALWWLSLVLLVGVGCYAAGYETRRAIEAPRVVDGPADSAAERLAMSIVREVIGGRGENDAQLDK